MVENLQALCIDTAYACAVGVGVAVASYGVVRGSKLLARNARKLAAVSLVGAILVGGMVVVGTDDAGTKQMENGEWKMENGEWKMENVRGKGIQGRARIPAAPQSWVSAEADGPALRRSRNLRPTGMASITDDDITQGWRVVSVSSNALPTTTFSLDCPAVQFLNDGIGGDRPERVYKVSMKLLAVPGTRGTVTLASGGGTGTTFYHNASRQWPVSVPETFTLEVPSSGGFESGMDFYITSAQLGRGAESSSVMLSSIQGKRPWLSSSQRPRMVSFLEAFMVTLYNIIKE